MITDPVRIYPMVNGQVLTAAADAVRLPDSVMRQFDELAKIGRRIAAEVATARAQRREAFRTALSLLKRRRQVLADGLSALEVEQITTEVRTILADRTRQIGQGDCERSKPVSQRLDALTVAAHAPPVRPASQTSPQGVLML
jgi:hypothetical protein